MILIAFFLVLIITVVVAIIAFCGPFGIGRLYELLMTPPRLLAAASLTERDAESADEEDGHE